MHVHLEGKRVYKKCATLYLGPTKKKKIFLHEDKSLFRNGKFFPVTILMPVYVKIANFEQLQVMFFQIGFPLAFFLYFELLDLISSATSVISVFTFVDFLS